VAIRPIHLYLRNRGSKCLAKYAKAHMVEKAREVAEEERGRWKEDGDEELLFIMPL